MRRQRRVVWIDLHRRALQQQEAPVRLLREIALAPRPRAFQLGPDLAVNLIDGGEDVAGTWIGGQSPNGDGNAFCSRARKEICAIPPDTLPACAQTVPIRASRTGSIRCESLS